MKYEFNDKEHLHLLDGKPLTGTSSIGNILAKPLTWWATGLACEKFGWLNAKKNSPEVVKQALEEGFNRIKALSLEEYEKLLTEAYYAHSVKLKDTAEKGTDLHEILERFVRAEMARYKIEEKKRFNYPNEEESKLIQPFIEWANKNIKRYIASEAHCFDEELWVGGITDCVAELMNGRYAVIDFKSAKEAYVNHFIQVSGYAIQIDRNGLFSEDGKHSKKLDKEIEVLIVVPFGATEVKPEIKYNIEDYKAGFRHAVGLYRLLGLEK